MLRSLLIIGALVVSVALLGSVIWIVYSSSRHSRQPEFAGPNHAADITIVSSRLYFTPKQDGKSVSIVGRLRNKGTVAVDRVTAEVRVSNPNGQLIDSFRTSINDHIEPGEEVSFKLSNYPNIHLPEGDYAKHEVIIRSAKAR